MHTSIQQRADLAVALRVRSRLATTEFYALIGKERAAQQIRFQVITRGKAYHIVDSATGKTKGFRWRYIEAISFAESLEYRASLLSFSSAD